MATVAHDARSGVGRPRLPTWTATLTSAFLGWILASAVLSVVAIAANALGLFARPTGGGVSDWPFPDAGLASMAANVVVWAWILALNALFVRGLLADRSTPAVSAATVACVLTITGFAPGLPRGLLDLPWPVAFVATAGLLRLAPAFSPRPLPKRATAALLAAGAPLLVVPAVHGLLHPLWLTGSVQGFPPAPNTATVMLRNSGYSDVRLDAVSLHVPFGLAELSDVRASRHPIFAADGPFPDAGPLPHVLDGRSQAFLQLRLRRIGCGAGPPLRAEATLRYRVHGSSHAERVPVSLTNPPCS